ncbi:MAG: DUF3131 domain-containing protein [Candidatus Omnitrophica bacterium]|nr:DUF3131 domain-containing protein [Candidatus Omnitrophota bacterium]
MKSFWVGSTLFLFFLSGCAQTSSVVAPEAIPARPLPPSLYETVPPEKNLRSVPQFYVIDDFNSRELKNLLGLPWETELAQGATLEPEPVSQGAFEGGGGRGSAVKLKVDIPVRGNAFFKSSLASLDMSQAEALVFKCQVQTEEGISFSGKLRLVLQDKEGKEDSYDFTSLCTSSSPGPGGWREVILPRGQFVSIHWDAVGEIRFEVVAQDSPFKGGIGLDEIAFYGRDDVRFESLRDNLVGFPKSAKAEERKQALLVEPEDKKFLLEIARDTWKYFDHALDKHTHLPADHIRVGDVGDVGSYTTPTNLSMYFLACIAAHELGFISKKDAVSRIQRTLDTLSRMKRWQGFYYNFYSTTTLQVTREYISAVDSGWLAVAWIVLRQAFPEEFGAIATQFLKEVDFYEFYDPSIGQMRLGFDEAKGDFSPYHYGILATEARATSFVGIGKGDLPREHWWFIYRTPPEAWDWQSQKPEGKEVEIDKVTFFEGHYTHQGRKFVPSWGGSLFEFLMPTLVMKEKELAPEGLGLNNRIATEIQIDYALNRQGYPIWGISPASTSSGKLWRYGEYGVKYLGVKGYRDEGIITPYVVFLALETLPEHAIDNLRRMLELYDIYGEYGFYDSINVRTGRVNTQYLALDQGMILAAICNYLKGGVIKEYFHKDEIAKNAESLLTQEKFFS